jgi:DNA-binding CsgD family transcriptional regulator
MHSSILYNNIMLKDNMNSKKITSIPEDCIETVKSLSDILRETLYVLDIRSQHIQMLSVNDMFLNIFTPNEVMISKDVFYRRIIHPEDLALVLQIFRIISIYWTNPANRLAYLRCITFNFRIRNHGLDLMICHCMKPYLVDGEVVAAFCSMSISTISESGNLTAFYKDSANSYTYSFEKEHWQLMPIIQLTNREKDILKLAKQGIKGAGNMANILHSSKNTVRNQREQLFQKLNVHSMEEAIIVAINYRLLFSTIQHE